jgi:thiamine-phosphate pyrophosphorylase
MSKPAPDDYCLYLVTDSRLCRERPVLEQVRLALAGGVRLIQVREKELAPPDYIRLARAARRLTREKGAWLLVNDCVDVALKAGADGVHLGQRDVPPREARSRLGPQAIIGVSVRNAAEAAAAERGGADYVAVNGVFPTSTKTDLGELPGLEGVRAIRAATRLPLLGIGGIQAGNCRAVIDAGADGVAVVTAITLADDIPAACAELLTAIAVARAGR